ncbi:MAG: hypothetical protein HBSAPP03_01030 [Phycisphaerae bacterium]|nr:MAG: hypothetical protein HBSAPP03_01030 [Phycisphaerae bacterium]
MMFELPYQPMSLIRSMLLVLVAFLPLGCAGGSYSRLVRESNVSTLASLRESYAGVANHTSLIPTSGVSGAPARVALHEIGARGDRELLVFVHGVFSDHRMWRFLAGDLVRDYDVLLIDLPGCGESDRIDPDKAPDSTYTPADLTRRLLEALQTYLRARPTPPPAMTVIAHSYGGALVIRAYGDPLIRKDFSDTIARIDRMILFAPLDIAVEKAHPILIELSRLSGVRVWSALQTGLLKERVAAAMLESSFHPHRALREEADAKMKMLTDWSTRRAMQATLNRAVPTKGDRPDWERIDRIVASYAQVDRPALIVWGVHDEVLPVSMGYKLTAQLPQARLITIPDGMHSFPLEQPDVAARIVRAFLTGQAEGVRVPPAEMPTP